MSRRRNSYRDPTAEKAQSDAFKFAFGQVVIHLDKDYRRLLEWTYGLNDQVQLNVEQMMEKTRLTREALGLEIRFAHSLLTQHRIAIALGKIDPDLEMMLGTVRRKLVIAGGNLVEEVRCIHHGRGYIRENRGVCPECPCGLDVFESWWHVRRKYCSDRCKQAAYRRRKKDTIGPTRIQAAP